MDRQPISGSVNHSRRKCTASTEASVETTMMPGRVGMAAVSSPSAPADGPSAAAI
ncbi:MAG: hypothetical protein IPG05_11385 [Gemmatimonadetes bacterium]|nr:hypothetical protein [Gemmatimonadota bacterium]